MKPNYYLVRCSEQSHRGYTKNFTRKVVATSLLEAARWVQHDYPDATIRTVANHGQVDDITPEGIEALCEGLSSLYKELR